METEKEYIVCVESILVSKSSGFTNDGHKKHLDSLLQDLQNSNIDVTGNTKQNFLSRLFSKSSQSPIHSFFDELYVSLDSYSGIKNLSQEQTHDKTLLVEICRDLVGAYERLPSVDRNNSNLVSLKEQINLMSSA